MSELTTDQRGQLSELAERVRDHFDRIEQDVPDQSFVVGGAVRDTLLGLDPEDLDFVVVGETVDTMEACGFEPIEASSFPVFHDDEHEEWALARTEQKTGEGYTGFEVFTDDVSLPEDLSRRDLTINCLALDPTGQNQMGVIADGDGWNLAAPMGANGYEQPLEDIQNCVLRHVSDAFADDPLRVLRTARYAGRFAVPTDEKSVEYDPIDGGNGGFERELHRFASREQNVIHDGFRVADETEDMLRQVAPELNRMSRDRIGDEITKALEQARRPSRIFEVLRDCGALAVLWPELDRAEIVPAGPHEHHAEGDTFAHTMLVLDRMHRLCVEQDLTGKDRVRRLLMALAHDIGKVAIADQTGGLHSDDPPMRFGGHAEIGASIVTDTARRLGLPADLENVMQDACVLHMRFHDLPEMPVNELLDFMDDMFGVGDNMGRELPKGAPRDSGERRTISPSGATVWELLDLACADEEGRLRVTFHDEGGGVTDTERFVTERGDFDRDPFEARIEAVNDVMRETDGHEALETGLCDDHAECEIDRTHGTFETDGRAVQSVMSACPSCRTPGEWVGVKLSKMKQDRIEDRLHNA